MNINDVVAKTRIALSQSTHFEKDGIKHERITWNSKSKCPDCGVKGFGVYHSNGCDQEICPVCGMQVASCDCFLPDEIKEMTLDELRQAALAWAGCNN